MELTKHEIEQLAKLLELWFSEIDLTKYDILNKNKVAKIIKTNLKKTKNWRDRPRGVKNSLDNLNKGKANKKELEETINNLNNELKTKGKCLCGSDIEVSEGKNGKVFMMCSGILGCKYS
jgi:hypothetical protein